MEIPLKSKPKVSTVNLLDESKFQLNHSPSPTNDTQTSLPSDLLKIRHSAAGSRNNTFVNRPDVQQDYIHQPINQPQILPPSFPANWKLTRRYSETEKNNFDSETGHRIYEDGKIRPQTIRSHEIGGSSVGGGRLERHKTYTQLSREQQQERQRQNYKIDYENQVPSGMDSTVMKIYSRSHNSEIDADSGAGLVGLEDEYIPGLDFSNMIYEWNKSSSDLDLKDTQGGSGSGSASGNEFISPAHTPHSREASYLDLKTLHAKVAPQPIKNANASSSKFSYSKLTEYMKQRRGSNQSQTVPTSIVPLTHGATSPENNISDKRSSQDDLSTSPRAKKQRSAIKPDTGDLTYEIIMNSLPPNFNELPYSQRKRIVQSFSDSIDYSQFSLFAKNYLGTSQGSGRGSSGGVGSGGNGGGGFRSGSGSNNNSFIRRPRMGSVNTIAGRLLARTSTTDFQKLQECKPKYNVDEKGAIVLGHELGKIIGFGAWGTIRECTDIKDGNIRACKIVKSIKENYDPKGSKNCGTGKSNPKVLQVFKKEIEIWKKLKHEHILGLIDYLETEHTIFCIMNRINGGTLFELVSTWGQFNSGLLTTTGPLEFSINSQRERLKRVIDCTSQIVNALLYMHDEKGIVHGDLKLENVLIEKKPPDCFKMILCDFGMSRIYSTRISRKNSRLHHDRNNHHHPHLDKENHLVINPVPQSILDEEVLMLRSRSTNTEYRKPYQGDDSPSTKKLDLGIRDDSQVGLDSYFDKSKPHGPSLQSVHLTPQHTASTDSLYEFKNAFLQKELQHQQQAIDSDLPHSHIGSLPYAAPELLLPSPPPLGPSADVWALGVLMYAMCVGKLPFQHQYEPRLRAMIAAGKYNNTDLKKACLLEWVLATDPSKKNENNEKDGIHAADMILQSPSLVDLNRQRALQDLQLEWAEYKSRLEFEWLYKIIEGCLEKDITKRWDTQKIYEALEDHPEFHCGNFR
ncbi:uncharacterized protein J8A68_001077 [[Candida] subhashii]|uniref:Protein kinase domain-containing protein n=1 Tax=[Candida] subhashii TaxID=561895 RepID=A0A8J5V4U7_9ASCO|nr:uncharacterized protein J8A68_001077 [[Candida] subhashii]KAG7665389.1 hypothetical protein J8A68_001077 [[Candida] subhashii]